MEGTSIGVLTTQFIGDITGITSSVNSVKTLIGGAQNDLSKAKFNIPVSNISKGITKSIRDAAGSFDLMSALGGSAKTSDLMSFQNYGKAIGKNVKSGLDSSGLMSALGAPVRQSLSGYEMPASAGKAIRSGKNPSSSLSDYTKGNYPVDAAGKERFVKFHAEMQAQQRILESAASAGFEKGMAFGPVRADFEKGLKTQIAQTKQFKSEIDNLSGSFLKLGAGITAIVSGPLAMFSKSSIMMASDAVEWQNVFDQTFGTILPKAQLAVKKFATEFDLSSKTANYLVGDIGELAAGLGFTEKKSLDLSLQINRLSADLTSFRNLKGGIQATTHALFMGLLGNSQSLKRLGIAVNQRTPEFRRLVAEMMATNNMTWQQARLMAILKVATEQTMYAVGDYARTQWTFANALRRVEERIIALKVEFGKILIEGLGLNYILSGLSIVLQGIIAVVKLMPGPLKIVTGFITLALIAIGPLIVALGLLGFGITNMRTGLITLGGVYPGIGRVFKSLSAEINANTVAVGVNRLSWTGLTATWNAAAAVLITQVIPAIWKTTLALLKSPVTWALVGVFYALQYAADRIGKMDWKNGTFGAGLDWLTGKLTGLKDLMSGFKRAFYTIPAMFVEMFLAIEKSVNSIVSSLTAVGGIGAILNPGGALGMLAGKAVKGGSTDGDILKNMGGELKNIWDPSVFGKNIINRANGWMGSENSGADKADEIPMKQGFELPKFANAALAGTAEGVAAMNRPTSGKDSMLDENREQTALLRDIRSAVQSGGYRGGLSEDIFGGKMVTT